MNTKNILIPSNLGTSLVPNVITSGKIDVSKVVLNLDLVNNTSDLNKPISTLTQTALNNKFNKSGGGITGNVGIGTTNPIATLQIGDYNNGLVNDLVLFAPSNGLLTGNSIKFEMNVGGGVARSRIAEIQSVSNETVNKLKFNLGGWNNNAVTSNVMTLQSDGNVGIGIENPTEKLEVNGNIKATGTKFLFGSQTDSGNFAQFSGSVRMKSGFNSSGSGNIVRTTTTTGSNVIGDAGTGGSLLINTPSLNTLYTSGFGIDGTYSVVPGSTGTSTINLKALGVNSGGGYFGDMAFHTSSGGSLLERLRILGSNGFVGMGTATPIARLHLDKYQQSFSTNLPSGALVISDLAGGNLGLELGSDATTSNYIQSRNTTSFTYYSLLLNPIGGRVGINNAAPISELDVAGKITAGGGGSTNGINAFSIRYAGTETINNWGSLRSSSASYMGTTVQASTTLSNGFISTTPIDYYKTAFVSGIDDGAFQFLTAPSSSVPVGNAVTMTPRMTITNAGNVGIGTTTPSAKLEVDGGIKANGTKFLFGIQTDDGSFAQFAGGVHIKGAFAYGNAGFRTESISDAGDIASKSGFYETSIPVNFPSGANGWWHSISSKHSNPANNYAMQIAGSFFDQKIYFRKTNTSATQVWREFVTSNMAGNVEIEGANILSTNLQQLYIKTNDAFGINKGAGISFGGGYTGSSPTELASVAGRKESSVDGEYGGYLQFGTRLHGGFITERMRISSTGNVGIGTETPLAKLDVAGNVRFRGDLNLFGATSKIIGYDDPINYFIGTYDVVGSSGLNLQWHGGIRLSDTTGTVLQVKTGKIGIGTTTPVEKLTVNGLDAELLGLYRDVDASATTAGGYLYMGAKVGSIPTRSSAFLSLLESGGTNGNISIQTRTANALTTKMYIGANGNVGIGTTNPQGTLDVNGNIFTSGSVVAGNSYQLNGTFLATVGSNSNTLNARLIGNNSGTDGMYVGYGNNLSQPTRIYDGGTANNIGLNSGQFNTNGITKFLFGNQTDDGTFAQFSGSVHVKSTLYVKDDISLGNNRFLYWTDAVGLSRRIIGLSVNGNIYIGDVDYTINGSVINQSKFDQVWLHNSIERMRLTQGGNLGIGTTIPTSKLQVVGLLSYADNAAATAAGLTVGAFYRTSTGVLMVVF